MLRVFILASLAFSLIACSNGENRLENIKAKGELVVLTRNAATTFYESREGHMGVEYEMSKAFADFLGVKVRFIQKEDVSSLFEGINKGEADFAAAGLTHTPERGKDFLFGAVYQDVTQQLVCRRGGKRPKNIEELTDVEIHVSADSSYVEQLNRIKTLYPNIQWEEVEDIDTETLLENVWRKKVDCTIADSNIIAINRRYFPELSVRFDMTEPESLAWVLQKNDDGLQDLIDEWFSEYKVSGKLEEVIHRYYGYIEDFDYVDVRAYQRKIKSALPKYKKAFKQAANKYNLNWSLLAAQAYQESHWRANAKSPTGVRGMMMLTRITAKELGVENRLDPIASIKGGALYLNKLRKRLPKTINEPDKTWIALAAYNVGMGHIWDARKLAKELNKNPDSWQDLATVLPLLTKKKYYKNLKHGYARGHEPVSYVKNIRDYQNMLEKIMKENSL
jgi:peptidoglycan lytic transglycosylase F